MSRSEQLLSFGDYLLNALISLSATSRMQLNTSGILASGFRRRRLSRSIAASTSFFCSGPMSFPACSARSWAMHAFSSLNCFTGLPSPLAPVAPCRGSALPKGSDIEPRRLIPECCTNTRRIRSQAFLVTLSRSVRSVLRVCCVHGREFHYRPRRGKFESRVISRPSALVCRRSKSPDALELHGNATALGEYQFVKELRITVTVTPLARSHP
jgi:hypothetical protein